MILPPPGWHHRRTSDVYVYVPREGQLDCVITYVERLSPLRSLPALVRETLASDPEFNVGEVFMTNRFVTLEGEYGARVTVTGLHHGKPAAHIVAGVFVEDFSTRLTARVEDLSRLVEYEELVHELAIHDRLALGARRRRVAFQPPEGWHLVPDMGLDVIFFSPEYPRTPACIIVSPSDPITPTNNPKGLLEIVDEHRGLPPPEGATVQPLATRANLEGEVWRTTRALPGAPAPMVRYQAILTDAYYYTLRLESLDNEDLAPQVEVFVKTAGSVESLPLAVEQAQGTAAPTFDMWSE